MIRNRSARPAGIFSQNQGLKKAKQIANNLIVLRDFPRFSRGLSQKPMNSRTNGWEPYFMRRDIREGCLARPCGGRMDGRTDAAGGVGKLEKIST